MDEEKRKELLLSKSFLSGLLGYSQRMGMVSECGHTAVCNSEKHTCPEAATRKLYEQALETAIECIADKLQLESGSEGRTVQI